jgi:hypothetical protein
MLSDRVSFDGRAIREGVFRSPVPSSENGQLDAEGNLIVLEAGCIYRARLGGENEVLYKPPSETELPTNILGKRHYFAASAVFGDLQ